MDTLSKQPVGLPNNGETDRQHLEGHLPIERYLSAIIAHELGNPFTAIIGRIEMLEMRKGLPDTARRDLEAMRKAGDRMSTILENLKAFSRGKSIRTETTVLADVIKKSTARFAVLFPELDVAVQLPDPSLKVQADPSLLEETLVSTFEALAQRPGGITSMDVGWGQDKEVEELSVIIKDDGRSFTDKDILRVFHPFSSGDFSVAKSLVTLSYGYYVIRGWGGTYRFPRAEVPVTELCLVSTS